MSSDFSADLRGELLDEFYSECDELITSVRGQLTELEALVEQAKSARGVVEGLFRNLHTLKGICAIAGVRVAEQLAHAMEDLLRGVTKGTVELTLEKLDLLGSAMQRFVQIVGAHRHSTTPPAITDLLGELKRWSLAANVEVAGRTDSSPASAPSVTSTAPTSGEAPNYVAAFAPSPALDQRGVNVSAVRTRLKAIGEIIKATPNVRPGGSVVFEFLMLITGSPPELETWAADSVSFSPYPPTPKLEAPVSGASDAKAADPLSLSPSHIVRVDLARLDDLMRITGEMIIHRSRLEEQINRPGTTTGSLKEINLALSRSLREMRQAVSRVRMVPIGEIFSRIPFTVRDLARDTNKKASVVLDGDQTEVDKYLVERLKEPLLHLVRNAFAHGVETPAERVAAGKPAEATISLSARSDGNTVTIRIRDDGRGVDFAAIARRAASMGIPVPSTMEGASVLGILCSPGFSTREQADLAAGRGVGMSVVANTVRELGGTLRLETKLGSGTEFSLKLPVTLSIADALLVVVGDQLCAVPQNAVDEITQVAAAEVRMIQQTAVVPHRGGLLPLVSLRRIFGVPPSTDPTLTLMVCSAERGAVGLIVDRVKGQREIVIRPLSDPLIRTPEISGATELGDGRPILILDPSAITQGVVRPRGLDVSPATLLSDNSSS